MTEHLMRVEKLGKTPSHRFRGMPELALTQSSVSSGQFRIPLYRYLTDNLPIVSACVWTWVRLAAAPGRYLVGTGRSNRGQELLDSLSKRLCMSATGGRSSVSDLLPQLLISYFRDGIAGGVVHLSRDGSKVDCFELIDPAAISSEDGGNTILFETERGPVSLIRPDVFLLPFQESPHQPLGRSLLHAVPFVAFIEQQLIDDMRRSNHNAGYHRLHVKITPPERQSGEAESSYTNRINEYFDATVRMIRSADVDENPVTWNNVEIAYVGPNRSSTVGSSWFMSHRAMIEDLCAGTNLAPFLLGYSYGATTTWAAFKFDVVMRQVRSVQEQIGRVLTWLGDLELALQGESGSCRWEFDNNLQYQALERSNVQSQEAETIIKLVQAGLLSESQAKIRAEELFR